MNQGFKAYGAEFIGTFTLCFVGQGAICVQQLRGTADLLEVALAHGLALAVMVSALGAVSGGHFNPAVSLGFLLTRRQSAGTTIGYWSAQILGAVAASYSLRVLFPAAVWDAVHLGALRIHPALSSPAAVFAEFVMTFLLVTAIWGTAVDQRHPPIGGLGIGFAVAMNILVGGPLTGAAMNPARAFGPALASGFFDRHWIHWAGPVLGGAVAALLYDGWILGRRSGAAGGGR